MSVRVVENYKYNVFIVDFPKSWFVKEFFVNFYEADINPKM